MSGPLAGLFGALLAEMSDRNAYDHGFDHVDYGVTEFDDRAGTPGLDTVRKTVKAERHANLLPPDLFNRFVNDASWRDPQRVPKGLRIV
jgi:sulfotransferase